MMSTEIRSRFASLRAARHWLAGLRLISIGAACAVIAACSSSPERPKPAQLPAVVPMLGVQQAWSLSVGESVKPIAPAVSNGLLLAVANQTVSAIDTVQGRPAWQVDVRSIISTPVGFDGRTAAVVTADNDLVAMEGGKEVWRQRLPARSFTQPLVAGRRVFVHMADRSVAAFDAGNGARLWLISRPGEPLVLQQSGAMLAVGDTLVVGLSGRVVGIDPNSGQVRWDATLANPRGTNEVERLVDLVGPYSRVGSNVCFRAFSAAVGCVDADRGQTRWVQSDKGTSGVAGDSELVVGTDMDGIVRAWKRDSGAVLWSIDRLKYRMLTAPLLAGRTVATGDETGLVHLLSRKDGSELNRLTTDGSAIVGAPVLAGQVLVVQTRKGGVFAWRPQ